MTDAKNVKLYTAAQTKLIDQTAIAQQFDSDGFILMQKAGQVAFNNIKHRYTNIKKLIIFCGQGNNGGDGFIIGKLAAQHNYSVDIYFLGNHDKQTNDSAKAYNDYFKYVDNEKIKLFTGLDQLPVIPDMDPATIKLAQSSSRNCLDRGDNILYIDALLGTGLRKAPEGDYKKAVDYINQQENIFAIDIPSGLDSNTGVAYTPCVKANSTISFIGLKQGLLTADGPDYCGNIYFDNLGVDKAIYKQVENSSYLITDDWIKTTISKYLPKRHKNSHKHKFGHILAIGGDTGMPGAITMAGLAAMRSGAGLTTLLTNSKHSSEISQQYLELMVCGVDEYMDLEQDKISNLLHKSNVIVIGPGLGTSKWSKNIFNFVFDYILESKSLNLHAVIIDADGLRHLADYFTENNKVKNFTKLLNKLVITPHPGEANYLLSKVQQRDSNVSLDRFTSVKNLAGYYNAIAILKGVGSLICAPESKPYLCNLGNPGMATAGMGDILTGVIAGLCAQDVPVLEATIIAVYVHAKAGDLQAEKYGERGLIATDILNEVRGLLNL